MNDGLIAEPRDWYPGAFRLQTQLTGQHYVYKAGLLHVQEEVSMIPPLLLGPLPGERILDLCAAPGNKTAQMAVAMRNSGTLVANDRSAHRSRAVRGTLDRLGILNTTTTVCNATNYPARSGYFDRILADVPCTCEGTIRKNPGVFTNSGFDKSIQKSGIQKAILRKAVQCSKPGGRIVYATCTFAPEENENVVDTVLNEFGDTTLRVRPATIPGLVTTPGITSWNGHNYNDSIRHTLRIWPHHNDTGGFFVAVLEKTGFSNRMEEKKIGFDEGDVQTQIPFIDEKPWLYILKNRFGIDPAIFENLYLIRKSRRYVSLISKDHQPPVIPEPDTIGMSFLHAKWQYPKLTAAAAMTFGHGATRNYILVDSAQMKAFYHRHDFSVTEKQSRYCSDTGFVLLRYEACTIGIGLFRQETKGGVVHSMFPKAWSNPEIQV